MRQYKTVVRTLLVLSVVDYTFASLALSRAIRGARSAGTEVLKVAEDVTHMGMGSDKEAMGLKANAPPEPASPDPKPNSEEVVFFNGELREKVQEYYIMATLLAVTTSVSRAAQFQISDKVDPGRYVFCLFFSSPQPPGSQKFWYASALRLVGRILSLAPSVFLKL